jgi:sugar-specific transcriptional regulator TrmB
MDTKAVLKQLGFSDKEADVYLAVLSGGPDSVRAIAAKAGINRGTAYDLLKELVRQGAVSYYNKEKKQYFVAEEPEKLLNVLQQKIEALQDSRASIQEALPELRSLYDSGGAKPTTKLYEGASGIRTVLEDVLGTCLTGGCGYVAYSAADLRETLYESFPSFTKERIKKKIFVRVVAMGGGGGEAELSERRWLTREGGAPTYTLIYGNKVAAISLSPTGKPRAVLTEDAAIAETQRIIFEHLWKSLK